MKKLLIGTTALVAAGALASGAQAADPISIGVGGYFHAAVSVVNQDLDENKRSFGLENEGEIYFSGSTTIDGNFIQGVGASVQLEAQTSSDQIDESYMWISGTFGQLRAGSFDGAMNVMGVYAPGVGAPLHGTLWETYGRVDGAGFVGEGAFGLGFDSDASKVAWYSPTVGGIRVGVSFTPEAGTDDAAAPDFAEGGGRYNNEAGEQSEVVGIGGNWSGDFGGASVSVGGGYTTASAEAPAADEEDREEWIVGARASMDAISVGGNYSEDNNGGGDGRTTWVVGMSYSGFGPATYGVRYVDTSVGERDGSAASVGFSLPIGSGLSVGGELQFWDVETSDGTPNSATVGIIGTTVRF